MCINEITLFASSDLFFIGIADTLSYKEEDGSKLEPRVSSLMTLPVAW